MSNQPTKGYKVTNPDGKCRGFLFESGKEYKMAGQPVICKSGFHYCLKASHCFNYHSFSKDNKVFEIEAIGDIDRKSEGDSKECTNHIRIGRQLEWHEVLAVANEGSNNTGHSNTGDRNTGDWNTGDWNTGNRNTGNRNTGNWNTGNRNTGNWNTGNSNTGDRNTGYSNTGNWNTGYSNTGNWNTGNRNTGEWNTGEWNTGNRNTGYSNTGDRNTGNRNTGNRNTGDSNTGDRNTGNRNTGNRNTGDWNTGDWNTGEWNTGNRNTGYSNTGNRNTGAFCTVEPPFTLFNKKSKWTIADFENSRAFKVMMGYLNTKMWVDSNVMTDEEKMAHPTHHVQGGYLKDIPLKDAWQNMWHNLSQENKDAFTSLPNFNKKVFKEITGIDVK